MWILDVGRMNFLSEYANETVNNFGKLLIWDIDNNCLIREFVKRIFIIISFHFISFH